MKEKKLIFTVGHSTRKLDEFIDLLQAHGIANLVDVRTIPRSRRNPQFNKETLQEELRRSKIRYTHIKSLGGLRHPLKDSKNLGWRNASFRGYADYMQTLEFEENLKELTDIVERTEKGKVAYMCAEALPWRCHRSLISDALTVRGFRVQHIIGKGKTYEHKITAFARIRGKRISYPAVVSEPASPKQRSSARL